MGRFFYELTKPERFAKKQYLGDHSISSPRSVSPQTETFIIDHVYRDYMDMFSICFKILCETSAYAVPLPHADRSAVKKIS
jgi:hypothetical protein